VENRLPGATGALYRLGQRCLEEPASRRLDGEVYCAIHNIADANPLSTEPLLMARHAGYVFVEHYAGEGLAWVQAPPYTSNLKFAEALLPEGLLTFYRDARRLCATALQARALVNEPSPSVDRLMRGAC